MTTIDTAAVNAAHDIRTLAAAHTTLRRESTHELSGPCPRCGGTDRFHAAPNFFFCRACYPLDNGQPHDAIGFFRWLKGASFREALDMLDALPAAPAPAPVATPAPPAPQRAGQTHPGPEWVERNGAAMRTYQEALWADQNPGRVYLWHRGLTFNTCSAYGLGFAAHAQNRGPAIAIPWYRGGDLFAIHYRFLDSNKPKFTYEGGSRPAGLLWGKQEGFRSDGRSLLLIEGEFNAMSVRQVARHARLDVLSVGGESAALTPAALSFIQSYPVRIAWMDKQEVARRYATQINGCAVWSVDVEEDGRRVKCDANELLQRAALVPTLEALLQRAGAPADDIARLGE